MSYLNNVLIIIILVHFLHRSKSKRRRQLLATYTWKPTCENLLASRDAQFLLLTTLTGSSPPRFFRYNDWYFSVDLGFLALTRSLFLPHFPGIKPSLIRSRLRSHCIQDEQAVHWCKHASEARGCHRSLNALSSLR